MRQGGYMPVKYEKPRVTKRDQIMIKWIAEQQVVRFDTLQELFSIRKNPISRSDLYSLCERWNRMGYIRKEKLLGNAPMIVWITNQGMRLSGLQIEENEKFGKPSFSTIHHNCAVSAVRVHYESNGYLWVCERTLRTEFQSSHLPDGMAYNNEFRILVEIDRTQKEGKRLQNIMATNARTQGISCVDYWVSEAVYPFVHSIARKLPGDLRNRVRIFPLPLEVNI